MKTKIFTLLIAAFYTVGSVFAQEERVDWVKLHPLSDLHDVNGWQVISPWDGFNGWNIDNDEIHCWDDQGANPDQYIYITFADELAGVKYFTMGSKSMWDGNVDLNDNGGWVLGANVDGTTDGTTAYAGTRPETVNGYLHPTTYDDVPRFNQQWYAKRFANDTLKYYVIYNRQTDKVLTFDAGMRTDEEGNVVHHDGAGTGNGGDLGLIDFEAFDARQHWIYLSASKDGYDPLAEYVNQTELDGGYIYASVEELPVNWKLLPVRSSMIAVGGEGELTYTWQYSTSADSAAYVDVPASVGTMDENFVPEISMAEAGLSEGDFIYIKRVVSDGTSTAESNAIGIEATEAINYFKLRSLGAAGEDQRLSPWNGNDGWLVGHDEVHTWSEQEGNRDQYIDVIEDEVIDGVQTYVMFSMSMYEEGEYVFELNETGDGLTVGEYWGFGTPNGQLWTVDQEGDDNHLVFKNLDNDTYMAVQDWPDGTGCCWPNGADIEMIPYDAANLRQQWEIVETSPGYDPFGFGVTAVEEESEVSVEMYPNPATTSVTISAEDFETIEIYNVVGQKIAKLKGGYNVEVNTSSYNSGLYIVKLGCGSKVVTKQLIIK